jgi:hypothetical protein
MKSLSQVLLELKPYLEPTETPLQAPEFRDLSGLADQLLEPKVTAIVLACRNCAEYVPSERTPSVGVCMMHAVQVLAQDKACSQYYQDEAFEPASDDDEF